MRPTPEQKETAKLIAAELLNSPEFMKALAKGIVHEANKRSLNRMVTEMIKENKVMFSREKGALAALAALAAWEVIQAYLSKKEGQ